MSLLVICEIIGVFFNTLTADEKFNLRTYEKCGPDSNGIV